MSTSMVEGSPLKLMLRFAMPLLAGNLLQQTYNIIDAAIVGQTLGAQALAGVGASSSVQFLVLGFCMGSCAGFGVPIAKYFGAGDQKKMRDCVFNGAAADEPGELLSVVNSIVLVGCNLGSACAPFLIGGIELVWPVSFAAFPVIGIVLLLIGWMRGRN